MTGEPMTTRGTVAGRAPHLQPPHANHPLQALRTDDIEVQVLEQGIELCSSERKVSVPRSTHGKEPFGYIIKCSPAATGGFASFTHTSSSSSPPSRWTQNGM
ncbi:AGAP013415-PA [Anopheles gambiae str. PEST]|uniref:AGAP013415-PA n=1 Tax=Anopheles gambiae TaxID=7165 RepID=F5HLJ9_ANOGA|nr:AGAP013415-PA [Anopheles gambiae str. PEST]